MVINRVQPLSVAKIAATLYAAMGLLIGIGISLFATFGLFANAPSQPGPFGMIFGTAAIIIMPIMYACFGFIGSLIAALLYNLVAAAVGGIELDVE
jgi:hypothetical protein